MNLDESSSNPVKKNYLADRSKMAEEPSDKNKIGQKIKRFCEVYKKRVFFGSRNMIMLSRTSHMKPPRAYL